MPQSIQLHVNGRTHRLEVDPERSLLSVLRDDLDITGPKYGCGEGMCGACTVLLEGRAVRSCITPVGQAAGKPITTIEGLEKDGRLHPVQQAFLEVEAFQCGYCTPGMILQAVSLLREKPHPTDEEIVRGLQGNVCRCGTNSRIVRAVRLAASRLKEGAR